MLRKTSLAASRIPTYNSQTITVLAAMFFILLLWSPCFSYAQTELQASHKSGERRKVPDIKMYPPAVSQELDGAFWRTEGGFQATIRISNIVQTSSIRVTPALIMADGTEYTLPPVDLAPAGVATISVNDALNTAPPEIAAHVSSFGSAILRFSWPWASAINGTIRNLDVQRSLTHSNSFQPSMSTSANIRAHLAGGNGRRRVLSRQMPMDMSAKTVNIEGVWWKHDPDEAGFVVLTNRSDSQIPVAVKVFASGEKSEFNTRVLLLPHQAQQVDLKQAFSELPSAVTNGGIRIQYKGVQGSILATGGLENVAIGYSAKIPFGYVPAANSKPVSWTAASVGIMHGPPDPMMQFPADTRFTSYALLRNISSQPLRVTPTLYVTPGRQPGTNSVNDQKLTIPAIVLKPGEVRNLELEGMLASKSLKDVTANLTLSLDLTGISGGLVAAIGSVDQSGNYVFEVEPHPVSSSLSKGICFFEVGNGNDTMVSLWNHSDQDEDLLVTLFFQDGHYKLPMRLAARQSAMFNVVEIIKAHSPDAEGNIIPASTTRGRIVVSGPEEETQIINVSINAATFSVHNATCDPLCQQCYGYYDIFMSPDSLSLAPGGSGTLQVIGDYDNGMQYYVGGQISSDNTAVATVSGGTVSAVSAGVADMTADRYLQTDGTACPGLLDNNGNPVYCPIMSDMQADAPVTVNDFTVSNGQLVTDGEQGSFLITVTSGTASTYQWSFTAPPGAGNNPNVKFASPTSAQTTTDSHWFALPNANCPQADKPGAPARLAPYTLTASVIFQGNSTPIQHTTMLNSNFIWFDTGRTGQADITGNPAMAADVQGVWHITGIGSMTRVLPVPQIFPSTASQFYNKSVQHEQVHVAQWSPGRLVGDLYIPSVLLGRVANFTGTSQADLQSQYDKAKSDYFTEEVNIFVMRKKDLEHEAFQVSDAIAPQYMIQNCDRF